MASSMLRKKFLIGFFFVLLLCGLARFPESLWAADEIKLGVLSTAGDHWPRWVAWDQGFFKEQNLEVREFQTDSIAKAVQALSANSTDLMFPANTEGVITAMAQGAPIKIIAGNFTKALY